MNDLGSVVHSTDGPKKPDEPDGAPPLPEIVQRYLAHLKVERRVAERTLALYTDRQRTYEEIKRFSARDAESYQYLHESIRRFPPQHELVRRMKAAGFGNVSFRNMTMGVVALHTGWRL